MYLQTQQQEKMQNTYQILEQMSCDSLRKEITNFQIIKLLGKFQEQNLLLRPGLFYKKSLVFGLFNRTLVK